MCHLDDTALSSSICIDNKFLVHFFADSTTVHVHTYCGLCILSQKFKFLVFLLDNLSQYIRYEKKKTKQTNGFGYFWIYHFDLCWFYCWELRILGQKAVCLFFLIKKNSGCIGYTDFFVFVLFYLFFFFYFLCFLFMVESNLVILILDDANE